MEEAIATKTKRIQTTAKVLKQLNFYGELPAAEQICQTHGQVGASGIVQNFRNSHFLFNGSSFAS